LTLILGGVGRVKEMNETTRRAEGFNQSASGFQAA